MIYYIHSAHNSTAAKVYKYYLDRRIQQIFSFDVVKKPLVSVICLCYNHVKYVKEALNSVIRQSYNHIELIIVDDGSIDGSQREIEKWLENHPTIPFVNLQQNIGNTRAFNLGLKLAKGEYVIDLAADDILVLNRIEKQVDFFAIQKSEVGVVYTDAIYVDESGEALGDHFQGDMIPYEGDVYHKLIDTYFIPPPTMMMRMSVLKELNGYDEMLVYEDFDFWIRSSRNWEYAYQPEKLTQIRKVSGSHGDNYF